MGFSLRNALKRNNSLMFLREKELKKVPLIKLFFNYTVFTKFKFVTLTATCDHSVNSLPIVFSQTLGHFWKKGASCKNLYGSSKNLK